MKKYYILPFFLILLFILFTPKTAFNYSICSPGDKFYKDSFIIKNANGDIIDNILLNEDRRFCENLKNTSINISPDGLVVVMTSQPDKKLESISGEKGDLYFYNTKTRKVRAVTLPPAKTPSGRYSPFSTPSINNKYTFLTVTNKDDKIYLLDNSTYSIIDTISSKDIVSNKNLNIFSNIIMDNEGKYLIIQTCEKVNDLYCGNSTEQLYLFNLKTREVKKIAGYDTPYPVRRDNNVFDTILDKNDKFLYFISQEGGITANGAYYIYDIEKGTYTSISSYYFQSIKEQTSLKNENVTIKSEIYESPEKANKIETYKKIISMVKISGVIIIIGILILFSFITRKRKKMQETKPEIIVKNL